MNRDDIIRMAREAGAVFPADGSYHCFEIPGTLERFAALVVQHEREACAKVCEEPGWNAANWCAKQIRARGKA
jgi:hypothetical protein